MHKILYISVNGMAESLGESQVVQYLNGLSKKNSVYLISFEKASDNTRIEVLETHFHKIKIQWKYFRYSNRFGALSSLFQVIATVFVSYKWIRKNRIEIVHTRSLIPGVIGLVLKKICGIKLLFDIRGFAIDEKIMEKRLKEGSIFTKFLKKIELLVYKNSDHVVTLTHNSKPIIQNIYSVNSNKISVIPTCANIDLFKPLSETSKLSLRTSLGYLTEDMVILRNGSLNSSYDLEAEFLLFEKLIALNPNIKLLFLNKGQHELILTLLDKFKIKNNYYKIMAINFDQITQYLNIVNLCVFFVKPTFAKQASAPTKFAELVACGIPTMTNTRYGDMEYYLNKYKVGLLVDLNSLYSNLENEAKKVLAFLEKFNKEKSYKEFETLFANHFSSQIAIEKYQSIYEELAK